MQFLTLAKIKHCFLLCKYKFTRLSEKFILISGLFLLKVFKKKLFL